MTYPEAKRTISREDSDIQRRLGLISDLQLLETEKGIHTDSLIKLEDPTKEKIIFKRIRRKLHNKTR